MATEGRGSRRISTTRSDQLPDKIHRSVFDLPLDFFDSSRLLTSHSGGEHKPVDVQRVVTRNYDSENDSSITLDQGESLGIEVNVKDVSLRLSCNTCKMEFESLQEQRSHFKSDFHRFNVKLTLAGKDIVKEEDLDETSDSFPRDFDVSSISGSEDEDESGARASTIVNEGVSQLSKNKLFIQLQSEDRVSVWKCLVLNDSENVSSESYKSSFAEGDRLRLCLRESDVIAKLKALSHEPRDNTSLRVVLLARGGHFAGCVFDGNTVVVHKTFHRYVVRAKAGKKQSSKDAGGRSIHSAGASLRRYNELALKKDIQELLGSWKPYFDVATCVFIHAPSNNHQLFFQGAKALFSDQHCAVRNIPMIVRRPTLKEAKRIYNQLTQIAYEVFEKEAPDTEDSVVKESNISLEDTTNEPSNSESAEVCSSFKKSDDQSASGESELEEVNISTPLHDAAKSGNAELVLELLEQGCDPTIKDETGKTPYMLATDKEARNNFRRFMASNIDKWDWHTAKVPSALTKELEEAQAAKQAEKDAKRKAKQKELKKLRKAREKEKKAQAQAAEAQKVASVPENRRVPPAVLRGQSKPVTGPSLSKEEELKRKLAEDREKRAAAAERRIAAAVVAQGTNSSTASPSTSQPKKTGASDACSCCEASLVGKVPFHRYNYKYCSTTCMHVHKEFLEDG